MALPLRCASPFYSFSLSSTSDPRLFYLSTCFKALPRPILPRSLATGRTKTAPSRRCLRRRATAISASASVPPLDLTEENVRQVLEDARTEFGQIFDASVGMTGQVDLADLDGPFVKLRLKGRFWHKRSTVLERLGVYLKNRIPEILEVDIEDEKQLDDSPENF